MRKLIAILISFMLLFTVAACFGKDDGKDNMNNNNNNGSSQGGSYNDGTNGGGSGGNMNGGSMNGGGMNNGSMNNGSMDSVEDLTDAERETLRSQIDSTHGLTFGDTIAASDTPETFLMTKERITGHRAAFDALTDTDRDVLLGYLRAGCNARELARRLGKDASGVTKLVKRAAARLQKNIEENS